MRKARIWWPAAGITVVFVLFAWLVLAGRALPHGHAEALSAFRAVAVDMGSPALLEVANEQGERLARGGFRPEKLGLSEDDLLFNEVFLALSRAARRSPDPAVARLFSMHESPGVRSDAAKNPSLPADRQLALALDSSWLVRNYLGANPALLPEVARSLAADQDHRVRWVVAKNPATPEAVLENFVSDIHAEVQRMLAGNPALSEKLMFEISARGLPVAVLELLKREDLSPAVLLAVEDRAERVVVDALAAYRASGKSSAGGR